MSIGVALAVAACDGGAGGGTDAGDTPDAADVADGVDAAPIGAWSAAVELPLARVGHSATRLSDDTILVTGGRAGLCPGDATTPLASALRVAPDGTVAEAAPLGVARVFHAAAALRDGSVLVIGGEADGVALASAERYDPQVDRWSAQPSLAGAAARPRLVPLGADGALAARDDGDGTALERFDGDGWAPVPGMPAGMWIAALVPLDDGGVFGIGPGVVVRVDAAGAGASLVAGPPVELSEAAAARLPDGGVLVVGVGDTGAFTEAGPVRATLVWRWDAPARWTALGEAPFGMTALTLLDTPRGDVLGRAGWGPWSRFDGDGWRALAATGSAQEGPLVALADGSLRLVGGSGNPTCAAVATVLAWRAEPAP